MKQLGLTISGIRHEIKLEEKFAEFVKRDLEEAGIAFHRDNTPDALLRAYLRLAKQANTYESELDQLIDSLNNSES